MFLIILLRVLPKAVKVYLINTCIKERRHRTYKYDAVSVAKLLILVVAEFDFSHRLIILLAIAKFDFSHG